MHYKTTYKKMGMLLKQSLMVLALLFSLFGKLSAQTYVNGNLSTGATTSGGTAAPAGTTWSEVQLGNTNAGFNASITQNAFRLGDNFVVPAGPSWTLSKITFYGYQTGYAGTTSPFNTVRVIIHSGTVTGPVVFGDMTTNRFITSAFSNMYRIFNNTPDQTRKIWTIEAAVSTTLAPGTYWIEYATDVIGGAGHFLPNSTVVGQVTQPGNNAQSFTVATSTWAPALDGANAQDMPFRIDYTTGACSGTPTPGATTTSAASACSGTAVTLGVTNATPGSGVTYQWQSASAVGGPYTNITGATNSTYTTTITATTYFQAVVTCGGNNGTSTPVAVSLTPASGCYCIPPATTCTLDDQITNVTFGTINNSSTCSAAGYQNYTATVPATTVAAGSTNQMKVTVGPGGTEYVGVWIDYNQNGTFDATEFTLLGSANGATITSNVTIPVTALAGTTRMRVRVRFATALTGADACSAYTYGETEDYNVTITPCVPVTVTAQPASATISCGGVATFTLGATGTGITYQWQVRTSATAPWQNLTNGGVYSGATTNTLTVTNPTNAINGYQYRVIYTGGCSGTDFSNAATLTVNPLVATVSPASASICNGAIQKLSITNTTPATVVTVASAAALNLTIPDDASTTGVNNTLALAGIPAGVTINSIRIKMNVTHSWVGDMIVVLKGPNGAVLNLAYALTGTGGAAGSTGFLNTTISNEAGLPTLVSGTNPYSASYRPDAFTPATGDPAVPTGPNGFLPTVTTFNGLYTPATTTTLNGNWTLAMYDYYDDFTTTNKFNNWSIEVTYSGGLATGVWTSPAPNSLYLDAAATVPYAGTAVNTVYAKPNVSTNYSVVVNNGLCTTAALTVPVTVNNPIVGTSTTSNKAVCAGGSTSFTASAPTSGNTILHQWKVSTNGGTTFTNITDGGVYSGATTSTLNITGADITMNGYRYKDSLYVTSCGSNVVTNVGILTVNPNPVIVVSAAPYTKIFPGLTTTLTAAVSPNAAATYQWYRNGVLVTGATNNTLKVDVDNLGAYFVRVNDVNGCNSQSASINISDSVNNEILFIYPSPNSGQFQVRYFSANGNNPLPRKLTIYDGKGARVFSRTYTIAGPYSKMDVDMKNHGKGIYMVELADVQGNRIKTGRVLIY
ncbi:MAG: hypothetical protein JWQ27_3130 [Ferruginibacter sp.]|nr:hypothetical protein [Ferruginibacter sp.]